MFKTPEFRDKQITSPVQVYIQLKRPSDDEVSDPKPFQYVPLDPGMTCTGQCQELFALLLCLWNAACQLNMYAHARNIMFEHKSWCWVLIRTRKISLRVCIIMTVEIVRLVAGVSNPRSCLFRRLWWCQLCRCPNPKSIERVSSPFRSRQCSQEAKTEELGLWALSARRSFPSRWSAQHQWVSPAVPSPYPMYNVSSAAVFPATLYATLELLRR